MKKNINYLFLFILVLFGFVNNTYAISNYNLQKVYFNKSTTVKYLTDNDKAEFMDKFGLTEYDGAVIITTSDNFSYLIDYYDTDMYDADFAPWYGNLNSDNTSFSGYICSRSQYTVDSEESDQMMEITRNGNKLSFGYKYGADLTYYRCGNTSTEIVASYMYEMKLLGEGLNYIITNDSTDVKTGIFVYYIKDLSKSVLNFKSSKNVTNMTVPAVAERNKIVGNKYFVPDFHKAELRSEYQSYFDQVDIDYFKPNNNGYTYTKANNTVTLIPETGFKFKIDEVNSTYDLSEIKNVFVKYYYLIRYKSDNTLDSKVYRDIDFYHYGNTMLQEYPLDHSGEYYPSNDGPKLTDMFVIDAASERSRQGRYYDFDKQANVFDTFIPNFVVVEIGTIDGETQQFYFAYDTPENRQTFGFTKVDKIEFPYDLPDYIMGDLDGNGSVELPDVIAAIKKYLGVLSITEEDMEILDMNDDKEINLVDITLIIKLYLGVI